VEDSWQHTIVPRLIAADADLSRVARLDVVVSTNELQTLTMCLPNELNLLEFTIVQNEIALVTFDPLLSVMGDGINVNQSREVRNVLDPLAGIADRTGAILNGIAHFNKSSGKDAALLIGHASAFKDVPRAVFTFARDADARVMTQAKNSLGRDDLPSLAYRIDSVQVPIEGELADVGRFTFDGETDRTVEDVIRSSEGDRGDKEERDAVADWLHDYIVRNGGRVDRADVMKHGRAAGFSVDQLKRARTRIGASFGRTRTVPPFTFWSLDPNDAQSERSRP
jgi:hypothetical protein